MSKAVLFLAATVIAAGYTLAYAADIANTSPLGYAPLGPTPMGLPSDAQGGAGSSAGALSAAETMAVDGAVQTFRTWVSGVAGSANGVPDWLKRFEIEASKQGSQSPVFSILTVQPLYQSEGKVDTVFTQLRFAEQRRFGDDRQTTNAGLGYRRLAFDNKALFGVNSFFDYEAPFDHTRAGVGAEARTSVAEVNTNYYKGLSGKAVVARGVTERPLDGGDVELGVQLPYLPWAKVFGKEFLYKSVDAPKDIVGQTYSAQVTPMPFLRLEGGVTRDNTNPTDGFLKLSFSLAFGADGNSAAQKILSDQPYEMVSMADHTLDKVRRENTIAVERVATTGGISIVIGRSN